MNKVRVKNSGFGFGSSQKSGFGFGPLIKSGFGFEFGSVPDPGFGFGTEPGIYSYAPYELPHSEPIFLHRHYLDLTSSPELSGREVRSTLYKHFIWTLDKQSFL